MSRVGGTRHALAGYWSQRPVPVFGCGTVSYEVGANIDATHFGGIAAVHRLVTKLGLHEQIGVAVMAGRRVAAGR